VDFGILARTHRFWPSDCNDALDRQGIHAGFLRFVPPELMGAHVGPARSQTTGRRLTMSLRAATALFGHMGLELDATALADEEAGELAAHIALYKRLRGLLHGGRLVRLDGLEPGRIGHGVVAEDGSQALFAIVQTAASRARIPPPVVLRGLDPARSWHIRFAAPPPDGTRLKTPAARAMAAEGIVVPGAALTHCGLQLPRLWPESALLLHLVAG
jgi:alpha-galactosidase